MRTVIQICNLNDPHLFECLKSIAMQDPKPDRVLIADGGSSAAYLGELRSRISGNPSVSTLRLDFREYPGTQTVTRQSAIRDLHEDITVFLDADEIPVAGWLSRLTSPLIDGKADFTGGRVKSVIDEENFFTSYYRMLEDHIYEQDVSRSFAYMPLGNTAWRTEIIKRLQFDLRLVRAPGEAEDYDLEMRALSSGYRGMYVPDALVLHFQRIPCTYWQLVRKRYDYLVGASTVMVKNGWLLKRLGEKRAPIRHPFANVERMMKPIALIHGALRWQMVRNRN